ncbi:unnamed protein product [Amoebophrya sp. A25]|nr:unnamed protein product [Amoebophrya sp. A25]|eukprot:GSA25T00005887001.1
MRSNFHPDVERRGLSHGGAPRPGGRQLQGPTGMDKGSSFTGAPSSVLSSGGKQGRSFGSGDYGEGGAYKGATHHQEQIAAGEGTLPAEIRHKTGEANYRLRQAGAPPVHQHSGDASNSRAESANTTCRYNSHYTAAQRDAHLSYGTGLRRGSNVSTTPPLYQLHRNMAEMERRAGDFAGTSGVATDRTDLLRNFEDQRSGLQSHHEHDDFFRGSQGKVVPRHRSAFINNTTRIDTGNRPPSGSPPPQYTHSSSSPSGPPARPPPHPDGQSLQLSDREKLCVELLAESGLDMDTLQHAVSIARQRGGGQRGKTGKGVSNKGMPAREQAEEMVRLVELEGDGQQRGEGRSHRFHRGDMHNENAREQGYGSKFLPQHQQRHTLDNSSRHADRGGGGHSNCPKQGGTSEISTIVSSNPMQEDEFRRFDRVNSGTSAYAAAASRNIHMRNAQDSLEAPPGSKGGHLRFQSYNHRKKSSGIMKGSTPVHASSSMQRETEGVVDRSVADHAVVRSMTAPGRPADYLRKGANIVPGYQSIRSNRQGVLDLQYRYDSSDMESQSLPHRKQNAAGSYNNDNYSSVASLGGDTAQQRCGGCEDSEWNDPNFLRDDFSDFLYDVDSRARQHHEKSYQVDFNGQAASSGGMSNRERRPVAATRSEVVHNQRSGHEKGWQSGGPSGRGLRKGPGPGGGQRTGITEMYDGTRQKGIRNRNEEPVGPSDTAQAPLHQRGMVSPSEPSTYSRGKDTLYDRLVNQVDHVHNIRNYPDQFPSGTNRRDNSDHHYHGKGAGTASSSQPPPHATTGKDRRICSSNVQDNYTGPPSSSWRNHDLQRQGQYGGSKSGLFDSSAASQRRNNAAGAKSGGDHDNIQGKSKGGVVTSSINSNLVARGAPYTSAGRVSVDAKPFSQRVGPVAETQSADSGIEPNKCWICLRKTDLAIWVEGVPHQMRLEGIVRFAKELKIDAVGWARRQRRGYRESMFSKPFGVKMVFYNIATGTNQGALNQLKARFGLGSARQSDEQKQTNPRVPRGGISGALASLHESSTSTSEAASSLLCLIVFPSGQWLLCCTTPVWTLDPIKRVQEYKIKRASSDGLPMMSRPNFSTGPGNNGSSDSANEEGGTTADQPQGHRTLKNDGTEGLLRNNQLVEGLFTRFRNQLRNDGGRLLFGRTFKIRTPRNLFEGVHIPITIPVWAFELGEDEFSSLRNKAPAGAETPLVVQTASAEKTTPNTISRGKAVNFGEDQDVLPEMRITADERVVSESISMRMLFEMWLRSQCDRTDKTSGAAVAIRSGPIKDAKQAAVSTAGVGSLPKPTGDGQAALGQAALGGGNKSEISEEDMRNSEEEQATTMVPACHVFIGNRATEAGAGRAAAGALDGESETTAEKTVDDRNGAQHLLSMTHLTPLSRLAWELLLQGGDDQRQPVDKNSDSGTESILENDDDLKGDERVPGKHTKKSQKVARKFPKKNAAVSHGDLDELLRGDASGRTSVFWGDDGNGYLDSASSSNGHHGDLPQSGVDTRFRIAERVLQVKGGRPLLHLSRSEKIKLLDLYLLTGPNALKEVLYAESAALAGQGLEETAAVVKEVRYAHELEDEHGSRQQEDRREPSSDADEAGKKADVETSDLNDEKQQESATSSLTVEGCSTTTPSNYLVADASASFLLTASGIEAVQEHDNAKMFQLVLDQENDFPLSSNAASCTARVQLQQDSLKESAGVPGKGNQAVAQQLQNDSSLGKRFGELRQELKEQHKLLHSRILLPIAQIPSSLQGMALEDGQDGDVSSLGPLVGSRPAGIQTLTEAARINEKWAAIARRIGLDTRLPSEKLTEARSLSDVSPALQPQRPFVLDARSRWILDHVHESKENIDYVCSARPPSMWITLRVLRGEPPPKRGAPDAFPMQTFSFHTWRAQQDADTKEEVDTSAMAPEPVPTFRDGEHTRVCLTSPRNDSSCSGTNGRKEAPVVVALSNDAGKSSWNDNTIAAALLVELGGSKTDGNRTATSPDGDSDDSLGGARRNVGPRETPKLREDSSRGPFSIGMPFVQDKNTFLHVPLRTPVEEEQAPMDEHNLYQELLYLCASGDHATQITGAVDETHAFASGADQQQNMLSGCREGEHHEHVSVVDKNTEQEGKTVFLSSTENDRTETTRGRVRTIADTRHEVAPAERQVRLLYQKTRVRTGLRGPLRSRSIPRRLLHALRRHREQYGLVTSQDAVPRMRFYEAPCNFAYKRTSGTTSFFLSRMKMAFCLGTTVDAQGMAKFFLLGVEPKWELFFPHIFCPREHQQEEDGRGEQTGGRVPSAEVLSSDAWLSLPVSSTYWRPIDKDLWHERDAVMYHREMCIRNRVISDKGNRLRYVPFTEDDPIAFDADGEKSHDDCGELRIISDLRLQRASSTGQRENFESSRVKYNLVNMSLQEAVDIEKSGGMGYCATLHANEGEMLTRIMRQFIRNMDGVDSTLVPVFVEECSPTTTACSTQSDEEINGAGPPSSLPWHSKLSSLTAQLTQIRCCSRGDGGDKHIGEKAGQVERTKIQHEPVDGLDLLRHTCVVSRRNLQAMQKNSNNNVATRSATTTSFSTTTNGISTSSCTSGGRGTVAEPHGRGEDVQPGNMVKQVTSADPILMADRRGRSTDTGTTCAASSSTASQSQSFSLLTREALAKHNYHEDGEGQPVVAAARTAQLGSVGSTMLNTSCSVSATGSPLFSRLGKVSAEGSFLPVLSSSTSMVEEKLQHKKNQKTNVVAPHAQDENKNMNEEQGSSSSSSTSHTDSTSIIPQSQDEGPTCLTLPKSSLLTSSINKFSDEVLLRTMSACPLEAYKIAEDSASYLQWEIVERAAVLMAVVQMEWQAPSRDFFEDAQMYFFNRYHKHEAMSRRNHGRGGGQQNKEGGCSLALSCGEEVILSPKEVKVIAYAVSAVHPPIFAYRGEILCASFAGLFSYGRAVP